MLFGSFADRPSPLGVVRKRAGDDFTEVQSFWAALLRTLHLSRVAFCQTAGVIPTASSRRLASAYTPAGNGPRFAAVTFSIR